MRFFIIELLHILVHLNEGNPVSINHCSKQPLNKKVLTSNPIITALFEDNMVSIHGDDAANVIFRWICDIESTEWFF